MRACQLPLQPWRALLLASMALAAATASAQQLAPTLQKIRETGLVSLGIRDRSVPFGYLVAGEPVGYGIDVCLRVVDALRQALARPDLRVVMHPVQSVTRFSALADGTIDLDCGTTSNTLERQRNFAFSNTYFLTANRFVSRRSRPLARIEDLRGLTVAITANTTNFEQLQAVDTAKSLQLKYLVVKDTGEGFRRFSAGEAEAFVADDILLAGLVAASAEPAAFIISQERLSSLEPYAIMLRRDDTAFKGIVDQATSNLLRSAEGHALYVKWFDTSLPGRGITLGLPMAPELRRAFAGPTDSPDPRQYEEGQTP